jgi:hypothetical protein
MKPHGKLLSFNTYTYTWELLETEIWFKGATTNLRDISPSNNYVSVTSHHVGQNER